jgi:hypothetical protein
VLGRDQESLVLVRWRRGDAEVQRGEADRYNTSTEPVLPTSDDCGELRGVIVVVARAGPARGRQRLGTGCCGDKPQARLGAVGEERLRELGGQLIGVRCRLPPGREAGPGLSRQL